MNGMSNYTMHRKFAIAGLKIENRLFFHLHLFLCYNHQFTFTLFCFIMLFHYAVSVVNPPIEEAWNRNFEGTVISGIG